MEVFNINLINMIDQGGRLWCYSCGHYYCW